MNAEAKLRQMWARTCASWTENQLQAFVDAHADHECPLADVANQELERRGDKRHAE